MIEISIVLPLHNEEGNIGSLHAEIIAMCKKNRYKYEIICVDDGSTDKTVEVCKTLIPVIIVELRKNFGQTAAMDAGLKQANHEFVVTMDGDGQNDPADIPKMIDYLQQNGLDVVSGWRKNRKDSFFKKIISRGANMLRRLFIHDEIHDSGCSLKVYKKECFKNLNLYGEMHRFIPGLLKIEGYRVGELVVNHRPRTAGVTKYSWTRIVKGFLDMVSIWFWRKFAVRPLHLLGVVGIFMLFIGTLAGLASIILFIDGQSLSDTVFPLLSAVFFISGIQVFIFGLIADMLSRSFYNQRGGSSYSIKEVHNRVKKSPAKKKIASKNEKKKK